MQGQPSGAFVRGLIEEIQFLKQQRLQLERQLDQEQQEHMQHLFDLEKLSMQQHQQQQQRQELMLSKDQLIAEQAERINVILNL